MKRNWQMRSRVRRLTLSVVGALAAGASVAPAAARAATPLTNTIVISPSSGCGLLTEYTAGTVWPAWSGPAPSCGAGALTLAFNQGTAPPAPLAGGVAAAGSALLAWSATGVPEGARMGYRISAPPGMTIRGVVYDASRLQNIADGYGWIGLTYSNSGVKRVPLPGTAVDAAASGPLNTPYWGIELRCVQSTCVWPGEIQLSEITVVAQEAQGPSVTPVADSGSLWDQTGHWIWNPPGDAWPLPVAAADPSGVCTLGVQVGTGPSIDDSLPPQNNYSWQECQQPASWTAAVDTTTTGYVNSAGQMPVTLQGTNAVGPPTQTSISETLNVDNDPVGVSLSTPDDPNPTVWVNHAVSIDATPSAGPSGLGGMTCGINGAAAQNYRPGGMTVDGDGIKTVSCTAWNNAVDPQGNHNSSTSTMTVHIDEAPPAISFQPENLADPTSVAVDTSDTESGVAAGSIEMAPAGTASWTTLPTTFSGSQLLAHFNDAGVHGAYAFKVTSCDNVGNCASATRTLALPVRVAAVSQVSIENIPASRCRPATHAAVASAVKGARPPASDVLQAVEPGSSLVRMGSSGLDRAPRAHPSSRVPEAGLSLTSDASFAGLRVPPTPVSIAAGTNLATGADTSRLLARSRPHRPRRGGTVANAARGAALARSCSGDLARLASRGRVAYGRAVTVRGLLMSSGGLPLAGQPVAVLTAPDNGSNAFTDAAAVTTNADGSWTATLPAGPSRVIDASYRGSPTILPASGYATVITPARIVLRSVTPDRTPWGSTVRITGRVLGGYIPASSKLLRLDLGVVGIPGLSKIQGIPNVSPDGRFTTTYTFGHAYGVVRFWLMVSSLAEADFPWATAHSRRVIVTVGVAAPPPRRLVSRSHHHRHKHKHRARAHPRHKER